MLTECLRQNLTNRCGNGEAMIYVVEILNFAFVKIGYSLSDDVNKRIAELQTGNPFKINPVFTIPGTLRQEKTIHAMLTEALSTTAVKQPPNEWYVGRVPLFKDFLLHLKHGFDFGVGHLGRHEQAMYAGCGAQKIERMDREEVHSWGQMTSGDAREHIPLNRKENNFNYREKQFLRGNPRPGVMPGKV